MQQFAQWARQLGLSLTTEQLSQFAIYEALLLEWNDLISLTAIRDPHQVRIRHFLDSISCVTVTGSLAHCSLVDVGTGGGFPGLPLKILFPTLRLTLVESVLKKCRFLDHVIAELGMKDAIVINGRAEEIGQEIAHRERYDWAVARAVAELRLLVEYLLPLSKVGGHALALKGDSAPAELLAAQAAIARLGGGEAAITTVQIPETEKTHYLVCIPKERQTEPRYPRRVGIPAKRPL